MIAGCNGLDPKNSPTLDALLVGTKAYEARVQSLPVSPQAAYDRLVSSIRQQHPDQKVVLTGAHYVILGDVYVFSMPNKMGISLGGYLVDGHTGEVSFRSSTSLISPEQQRQLWGKVVVAPASFIEGSGNSP